MDLATQHIRDFDIAVSQREVADVVDHLLPLLLVLGKFLEILTRVAGGNWSIPRNNLSVLNSGSSND